VWIINPEDTDTLRDPVENNSPEFIAELRSVFTVEVKWIDVLIFLWGIFCVLHGTVRPLEEPFFVFFDVWMVRRTLEC
jgi:hypothetical protein